MKRVVLVVLASLMVSLFLISPAQAVETSAVRTETFGAFADGNWGWFKLVVEKDATLHKLRAKVTVWCEPNNTLGGTKVACDAIQYRNSNGGSGGTTVPTSVTFIAVQYWNESSGWITTISAGVVAEDFSPTSNGLAITTAWEVPGQGTDQYRGIVQNFRAASTNEWSTWKERVTPTWEGTP